VQEFGMKMLWWFDVSDWIVILKEKVKLDIA
jgi:hypothetical protein